MDDGSHGVKLGTGDLCGGRVCLHKGKTQHRRLKGSRKRNQGLEDGYDIISHISLNTVSME